ncbi:MAG TPA: DUF5717 family protein [Lachnospiraceae bacterium]|nr:DUF5717 family protein [Lachnospiraceae bacterium]
MNRFIQGDFEYESGSLDFSCQKIELTMKQGEVQQGNFTITSASDTKAEGKVESSHLRMSCLTPSFQGEEITIFYSFSSKGMEEGEIFRGDFNIVSNKGEYYLPFVVTIDHAVMESSIGKIKNLFHFANLAKTNWGEAVRIFYSYQFEKILTGNDRQFYNAYLGLSKFRGNEQNVDEFLIEISKKQKTEYIPMEEIIPIDSPIGITEGKIAITRNGWGYTFLEIETDGDFLTVEKNVLSDDDFLGNICSFSYCIDSSKTHCGNNYGYVRLSNSHFKTDVKIIVINPQSKSLSLGIKKEMRHLTVQLMEYYGAFRTKKISTSTWLTETKKIVDRMNTIDEYSVTARLFRAQLLITEERYNEAKWLLNNIENEINCEKVAPVIWCYYLYLTTLYNREEGYVNEITEEVESIYVRNPGNWRIAWLLLYLREEFSKSPSRKWIFLENQFLENCTSPVLYMEAVTLINANPTLLMKLTEFEIQILNYAAKKDILQRDVIVQMQYLVTKAKGYTNRIFYILQKSYDIMGDDDTLQSICSILMKGNKVGEEYFKWYSLGVQRELRITRLYEFYMMSLPLEYDQKLPKMVMMYFAYHNELDYRKKALLYANIVKHQEVSSDISRTYHEPMEVFLVEQIKKGHINRQLAYLYSNRLTPYMLKEEHGEFLTPLLFMNLITVTEVELKNVVLIYDKINGENLFPIVNGTAYVPIYSTEYKILLQDGKGNRYSTNYSYTIEKLMIPGKYIKEISLFGGNHIGIDLYLCENSKNYVSISEKNEQSFRRLWESEMTSKEYKKDIRLKLIQYYYDNDFMKQTDDYLEVVQPDDMDTKERAVFIKFLVARGMLDKAFEWIKEFGDDLVDPHTLVRLCSRTLARTEFEKNEVLLKIVFHAFKCGRCDENILKYLVAYYSGMTKDMRDIRKAAIELSIDTQEICERMIIQMLYSGSFVGEKNEIFQAYVKNGSKLLIEMAFLSHSSYEYFVKNRVIEESIFQYFTKLFYRGENFHEVCRLAYLKYYSENRRLIGEEIEFLIRQFMNEFILKNIYFPFFQEYIDIVPQVEQLMDKTMIEYRANPKCKVMLHYIIQCDEVKSGEYCKEEMINMYEGIFVKSFTLFFGEKLQYYITEEINEREQLTESGNIGKSDISQMIKESKFQIINDMVIGKTLQDYDTVNKLMVEFLQTEYLVDQLFHII